MSSAQLNMFSLLIDPAVPYVAGSKTSKDAADKARPTVLRDRDRVLAYLQLFGSHGATDQEIQDALGLPESTERPRRCSLVDDGLVVDSGKKRPTRSGRDATVWMVRKETR